MASTPLTSNAPAVRLELRHGSARPSLHDVVGEEFLVGSVPGCDLRLSGSNLPPIICQIIRREDGLRLRKLAPTQPVLLNGQPVVTQAALAHGDCIQIGPIEIHVHLSLPEPQSVPRPVYPPQPTPGVSFVPLPPQPAYQPAPYRPAPPPQQQDVWQQFQAEVQQFREQAARFEERRRQTEADDLRRREALDAQQRHVEEHARDFDARQRQLDEQTRELESDRVLWYRRRDEIEHECHQQKERADALTLQLQNYQQELTRKSAEFQRQEQLLELQRAELERAKNERAARDQHVERESREVAQLRQELATIQQELAGRVSQSRDQLAQHEAALRAAEAKLQQERVQFDAQVSEFTERAKQFAPRLQQLDTREQTLTANQREIQARAQQLAVREADLQSRESRLSTDQQSVQQIQGRYQGDLVRLDRMQQDLEQKQREIDQRYAQMERDARELEEQARQVDANQDRLREETERLTKQKAEQDVVAATISEKTVALEGQQAMLAGLRTRLERMREEMRQQAQQLATERGKQEELANQLKDRLQTADKLKSELDEENKNREQQRTTMDERGKQLQAAIAQMRQLEEKLNADEKRQQTRGEHLDAQATDQAQQAGLLRARAQQLLELQQRLEADRQSLRERETALSQTEEARKTLQEQLRRRGEELSAKARTIEDQILDVGGREAEVEKAKLQAEQERKKVEEHFESLRRDLDTRAAEIQRLNAALTQREENLRRQVERLKEAGQTIAADRKAHFETKGRWENDQTAVVDQMTRARSELEAFRNETLKQAAELARLMPELELRSQGSIDRLAQSREQLRGHLAELHTYARQSQEDLQELRTQVQAEAERLRQQELALHRARSEHRLSVTAFRQQLIDWQGRVGDMKQLFTQSESRLELKQQEVEQAAREVDAGAKELAKRTETLEQQKREVAVRKTEVESHLGDMQDWYREKLRELVGGGSRNYSGEVLELPKANSVNDPAPPPADAAQPAERDILTITGEVDPADRKLGELLLKLGLVEQDMLIPLWAEARRQRRSLRQVLLTSGTITLYQMALIEAGNVDGLVLGAFRVIDRLQATPRETLYRVFDPSRSSPALLRHLAETEMADAIHPDEYRQRFGATAALPHPNLAATYAVQEINSRPAVLQEWVSGLASPDWPALAAVPGVWYRLLGQAALGLQAAHQAGITHGHLTASNVVLTADGTLKISGVGEPAWLTGGIDPADGVLADLLALGKLASDWSMLVPRRKSSKPKPLPEGLQNVIRRLGAPSVNGTDTNDQPILVAPFAEAERYASMAALLEDLEIGGDDIPPNAEAWDRLVKHVSENATEGAALRRTA